MNSNDSVLPITRQLMEYSNKMDLIRMHSIAFHPKALNDCFGNGRSSDLFLLRRLPGIINQWLKNAAISFPDRGVKLTATGIVPDLHRVPF